MKKVLNQINEIGIVPVVVLEDSENAIPLAKALLEGGIQCAEITLRTAAALECIKLISDSDLEILVGAGTVVDLNQCQKAIEAGANFIVMPGYDEEIVSYCIENEILVIPGCVTPTEIMKALSKGLNCLKFFPANVYGGIKAMKALSGPFPNVKFMPTGGINEDNLKDYISQPYINAVGGSWLCDKNDIKNKDFDKITRICEEAIKIVQSK